MSKSALLLFVLSVAACRGSDPDTVTFNVSRDCRLHEEPGTIATPYVAIGAANLAEPSVAVCGIKADCPAPLPMPECALRPEAQVQVLAVTPDGFVGRVLDPGSPAGSCADKTVVWLLRGNFASETGFDFPASMFPARCSARHRR